MVAVAMPRRPRPDSTLVLLVAIAIASCISFFAVLSNVHASERQEPLACESITIHAITTSFDAFADIAAAGAVGTVVALFASLACSRSLRRYAIAGFRARRQAASTLRTVEHLQLQASRSIYR
jgi:hypothetical protein